MKKVLFICFCLISSTIYAQKYNTNLGEKVTIDYGIKAGFNSAALFIHNFSINNEAIKKHPYKFKTGVCAAAFMRINIGNHFLQPELNFISTNEEVHFILPQSNDTNNNINSSWSTKRKSIDIPVLYGYHVINKKPWKLSVFAGPQFKLNLNNEYHVETNNANFGNITEVVNPFNLSFSLGVEVTINHIFFDYRYEIGIFNINKEYKISIPENNIILKRNINILSFSVGYIF